GRLILNKADFRYFEWRFEASTACHRLEGRVWAEPRDFVGLHYENPDGSLVDCLNSKIAHCHLLLYRRTDGAFRIVDELSSDRAAFEVLTDAPDHGIPIVV
ncbi:MAG: hypothetical protein KC609_09390, partial [Myxococcales bacterium]|nr:hypothetical protein [Myxococcales bacterium]